MIASSFATFCDDILGEPISPAWATFYKCLEGEPLTAWERSLYLASTGRSEYVPRSYVEATGIIGRRGEKTTTALKFLIFKILTAGWESQARPSLLARLTRRRRLLRVPIIAQDMRVAGDIKLVAEQLVLDSPVVEREVADIRNTEIVFRNGIALTVFPCTRASVRGLTCPACLCDELAWCVVEGASDVELLRQIRPSMIQFGPARRLLKMSTPWMKSGLLYEEYSRRAERPDVLCWQAGTETMTPRIDAAELEKERALDPVYFAREYEAQFVDDLESFLPQKDIDAAIGDYQELPPRPEPYYVAAIDASSIGGKDRFAFGIAHTDESGAYVDVLRGWRRATVREVMDEIAKLAGDYNVAQVLADQYSFVFVKELFAERGVFITELAFTARSKAEVHFSLKNTLARGTFHLPENPEAAKELRALESIRTSGGGYRISAPRGANDDYATVVALLAWKIAEAAKASIMLEYLDAAPAKPKPITPGGWAADDAGPERLWRRLN